MISGLQKMTLLDYPGKVACTVFLQGCNLRCPFCHNSGLLPHGGDPLMKPDTFLDFLRKRRGLLDAVCVSGGEPTLDPELEDLLRGVKSLGYAVKLDTNGTNPAVLKQLVGEGLLDYVAMDVKNSPTRYAETAGLSRMNLSSITESLRFLLTDAVPYELRTTVVAELHDKASILEMGQWLRELAAPKKPASLYLQPFVDRESVVFAGLHAPEKAELEHYCALLTPFVEKVQIRSE